MAPQSSKRNLIIIYTSSLPHTFAVAQEGFEPSASLVLSESGLPVAYRAKPQFRGLESNQRPPRSERGVTTSSNCPGVFASFGKKDSNLHRLSQSQAACQLADSRVESACRN